MLEPNRTERFRFYSTRRQQTRGKRTFRKLEHFVFVPGQPAVLGHQRDLDPFRKRVLEITLRRDDLATETANTCKNRDTD